MRDLPSRKADLIMTGGYHEPSLSTEDTVAIFDNVNPARIFLVDDNTGQVYVRHDGYTYTISIPPRHRAAIVSREGFGGAEYLHVNATPEQDQAVRAAMRDQGLTR